MKLTSERLMMEQLSPNDWSLFHSLHADYRVISLCFDEPSMDEIKVRFASRLRLWLPDSSHWLCLVVTKRNNGKKVGVTGFCIQDGVAEVGFMFLPEYQGLGYATESLKSLIEYSRIHWDIEAFNAVVTEGNIGSERVLVKSGFSQVKVITDAYEIGGKLYSDHIYHLGNIVI
ncbi:GNAT family N-acetyltransferase [Photobacterium nomapromontoriensis]|uniref:GNAT family N-acetyltransferase n=1 Tax=Photobacterium nomapromontoriensis TaxID=2910237 RepID=UPI003D0BAC69